MFNSGKPKRLKVQFLARKADIIEALGQGNTRMEIWEVLKHQGSFTGNYSSFCFYVSTQINNQSPKVKKPKPMSTPTKAEEPAKQKNRFNWTPNYDPKKLTG
ncbi:hypothetical protein TUM4438_46220 [Shewanella sairae]|uniref:TraK n=2 Tax=Shewanella sairae TaxID=190310 RepID=A0ABQ4PSX4_9GAMM|nr:TraK family protein [Shewanella sairae]GIU52766.1 hypothetical protein TUM4438_46220 [Shewanella sairae]